MPIISVENLSKSYRLGQIGTGTFANDVRVWWAKTRGRPNPLLRIGEVDHGNHDGDDLWALRDVSFSIEQGEVLGIIGRNGAGKSTLLKILSRVTAPTSGRIKVNGRIASLLEVGTGFHPDLTGRENIYLNGAILGMNQREISRKFDEIVDFAEIENFIDTPVKRYSSGMYVRLAFAVAAHLEPEILIIDEVLAVGDTNFQKKCMGKMGQVAHEGRTIFFVSHSMSAIMSLCAQTMWLDRGKIKIIGSTEKVVSSYLRPENYQSSSRVVFDEGERPGDNLLRINAVELKDPTGKNISEVQISQPCKVEISFDVLHESIRPSFAFTVWDTKGNLIFMTMDNNHENLLFEKPLEVGSYMAVCNFPGNIFNEDTYFVTIHLKPDQFIPDIVVDSVISIKAQEDGVLRGNYHGRYPGFIRPKLIWTIEKS